jgi:hypothetical protein
MPCSSASVDILVTPLTAAAIRRASRADAAKTTG